MGEMIRNCRLCKQPMAASPFMTCPDCLKDSEKVRSFILKNPRVTVETISKETRVPLTKVKHMYKLGYKSAQH